jgi:hypothetical protein
MWYWEVLIGAVLWDLNERNSRLDRIQVIVIAKADSKAQPDDPRYRFLGNEPNVLQRLGNTMKVLGLLRLLSGCAVPRLTI